MNGRQKQGIKEPISFSYQEPLKSLGSPSFLHIPSLSLSPHSFSRSRLYLKYPHLLSSTSRSRTLHLSCRFVEKRYRAAGEDDSLLLSLCFISSASSGPLFVFVCVCLRVCVCVFYVTEEVRVIRNRVCLRDNGK